ncbi:MAG: hypothetical protein K8T90_17475 [Planctomycetes bacterium]|nr:hypothetical protein [Planctomycetota bacterium]
MPIQDPAGVAKEAEKLEADVGKWIEQGNSLDKTYQKKWAEFGLINGGLWEGSKEIDELVKSLTAAFVTFDKMTSKAGDLRKDLTNIGKMARDLQKQLASYDPKITALKKDAEKLLAVNKTSAQLKTAIASMIALDKACEKVSNQLEADAQDCEGSPKSPPRVKPTF